MNKTNLLNIFKNFVTKNNLPRAILSIQNGNSEENQLTFQHGSINEKSPFILASVTKLWATTLILELIDQEKIHYDTIVTDILEKEKLEGIYHIIGEEHISNLTIKNLLFQSSGLPNVFYEEPVVLKKQILSHDFSYSFDDVVGWAKQIGLHFPPGEEQAYYADINFLLLGLIIEKIYGTSFALCVEKFIINPLNLKDSFVTNVNNSKFDIPSIYTGKGYIQRPNVIIGGQAAGGGVSTTADLMVFIKAFIKNKFFDPMHWKILKHYHPLQEDYAPVEYGGGHMKIVIRKTDQSEQLSVIGHSGISGAFAFYCPQLDLYLTGTTDNAGGPQLCIQLVYLILLEIEKNQKENK